MTNATYHVTGMTCEHCVTAVTEALRGLAGVHDVSVDLGTGIVTITADVPPPRADVAAAVTREGYHLA